MTPMNLVSEIAQPISMAFRHFGNIAGGSVLTSLVYSALATVSAAVLGLVGKSFVVGILILVIGAALLYSGVKSKKDGAQDFRRYLCGNRCTLFWG